MYELEQLRGEQGLLSHSTLPRCGEEKAFNGLNALKWFEGNRLCVVREGHIYLTGADVARPVRRRKLLAIAIDTMVVGAAFTLRTTGA